jgi:ribose transport system ATP-binding protein
MSAPDLSTGLRSTDPVVSFDRIQKSFSGVPVLRGVSFGVGAGRLLGLVGENGAGKSTLMNLLGGNLVPDAGELRVNGQAYAPRNSQDARRAGIAFVHQELNLFPNLSIAENLFLTAFPCVAASVPWIDRSAMRARTQTLLRQVGLEVSAETRVERLSTGERQLVEIAKALGADARILLLDEPTTSLSVRERDRLFTLLDDLRQKGLAILYISHALEDVLRMADDVVVLRDGEVVGRGPRTEFTPDRLVSLMVGRELAQLFPERSAPARHPGSGADPQPMLQVQALSQPGVVRDITFSLGAGEVLGLAGLMGAGRSELARILFGLDPCRSGEIRLEGEPLKGPPRERIRRGLAFLTEDRRAEGLCLAASIADNLSLVTLERHSRTWLGWLDQTGLREVVRRMREAVRLAPQAGDGQPVRTLSGGNQQKVVLGKWLLAEPKVLILDEPTRGIDVGAKFEIYQLIHQLADRGAGVLVISSELEELMGLCDRILVLRQGAISGEFPRERFDREALLQAALPVSRP